MSASRRHRCRPLPSLSRSLCMRSIQASDVLSRLVPLPFSEYVHLLHDRAMVARCDRKEMKIVLDRSLLFSTLSVEFGTRRIIVYC